MKTDKKLIFVILGVVIVALAVGLIARLRVPGGYSGPMESITLGTELLESSIPIFVAEDQKFFTHNGLNVTIKYYDTGLKAVNGMLKGEADVA